MEPARKQENSYEEEIDEEIIPTQAVVCCTCIHVLVFLSVQINHNRLLFYMWFITTMLF